MPSWHRWVCMLLSSYLTLFIKLQGFPLWLRASVSSTECLSPPARSSGRLLTGPSSRNTAPLGRRKARHHSNLGTASSRQLRTHHRHLRSLLTCGGWNILYDMWLTSRQPTTRIRCGCMRLSTSTLTSVGPWLQPLRMAYSKAVQGRSSMAWRFARFLHRCLQRGRRSPGGWGHGRHVGLSPVRSQSCMTESPNLWYFFIWHYCFLLLFPLWFDIISFVYFVIFVMIWQYLPPVIMSIVIELNILLLLLVICCLSWVILPLLAYYRMYFAMVCLKCQK